MKRILVTIIVFTSVLFLASCNEFYMTQNEADDLKYYSTEVLFPYCENELIITSPSTSNYYDYFFTEDHKIGRNVPICEQKNGKNTYYRAVQLLDPSNMETETIVLQVQNPDTLSWEPDTTIQIWYDMITLPDGSFVGMLPPKEYPYTKDNTRRIICWNSDGKKRFELSLTEDLGIDSNILIQDTYSSITASENGDIYIFIYDNGIRYENNQRIMETSKGYLFVINQIGELQYSLTMPEKLIETIYPINGLPKIKKDNSGNINLYYFSNTESNKPLNYVSINSDTQSLQEPIKVDNYVAIYHEPYFGDGFDVYRRISDQFGFGGRNSDGTEVLLFKYSEAKVDINNIIDIHVVSHDKIYWIDRRTNSDGYLENVVTYISTSLPEDNRTPVRIAFDQTIPASATTTLTALAREFNKTSATHRIDLIPYADDEVGRTAAEKLKQDITTGDIPDMILFGAKLSPDTFINLDIFADFYDLMDGEYKKSDFLGCVTKPYETSSGELPVLVTDFRLETLVGKASIFGERTNWSFEEMLKMNKSLEGGQALIFLSAADDANMPLTMLEALLPKLLDRFVDYEAQTVDFNNATFRSLLEFCRDAKVLNNSGGLAPNYYHNEDVLLSQARYHFDYFFRDRYLDFPNGDLTYIGYPTIDKNQSGTVIVPILRFGIVKKSEHAELAWEFIKDYLDAQRDKWNQHITKAQTSTAATYPSTEMLYFPSTDAALDNMLTVAQSYRHFYRVRLIEDTKAQIERVGYNYSSLPTTGLDADEIERQTREKMKEFTVYFDVTDEDADALRTLLDKNLTPSMDDTKAISIIMEDAAAWLDGIKSMDEVIRLIENRVGTLVNE